MSIDFVCAKILAEQHLRDLESQPDGEQYVMLDEFIREDEEGWYPTKCGSTIGATNEIWLQTAFGFHIGADGNPVCPERVDGDAYQHCPPVRCKCTLY